MKVIKQFRLEIDSLATLCKTIKPIWKGSGVQSFGGRPSGDYCQSKELEKATDELLLAKAWLGKVLQYSGEETPYKNDGKRKSVNDIELAADSNPLVEWPKGIETNIEKVDYLREEIKAIQEAQLEMLADLKTDNVGLIFAHMNFQSHITEARFWLGFELQRIKINS